MVHFYRIAVGLLLYVTLIYSCRSPRTSETCAVPSAPPQPSSHADLFPGHGLSMQERETFKADLAARAERLAAMEAKQVKHALALAQRTKCVVRIQKAMQEPWDLIVSTNLTRFAELKASAARATSGEVVCDICDTQSYMPCILCERIGKCEDCLGTGEATHDQLCPTCVGTGKCSMCSGFGKMLCPFCDDGTIYSDHSEPRQRCWVE